ncbi:hypothetical protein [Lysobacter gummosus]|uniref:hypothetical protein n=1 Tax=Lysobacter gummosus TaxID=262324 RepID=UPI00363F6232
MRDGCRGRGQPKSGTQASRPKPAHIRRKNHRRSSACAHQAAKPPKVFASVV